MTIFPSLLSTLHAHAQLRGDRLAHHLPDRVITYRRFWSRIERASARLQGEWGVMQGDCVIYWGMGHPDAIILYCALLRIGASLCPLEDCNSDYVQHMAEQLRSRLVVHDDALRMEKLSSHTLSSLLAAWSHFDPHVVQDDVSVPALFLPSNNQHTYKPTSLRELMQSDAYDFPDNETDSAPVRVDGSVFRQEMLTKIILPALMTARHLQFSLTEPMKKIS